MHRDTHVSEVYKKLEAFDNAKHTPEEFSDFYKKLVKEAFRHGSEFGSEQTSLWILNCLPKVCEYLNTKLDQVSVIVLNCGFTLYNLALDHKGRYGRGGSSKFPRVESLWHYRALAGYVNERFAIQQKPSYLNTLADLIEVASYTSTGKMTLAKDMLIKDKYEDAPDLLVALFAYHAALVNI